MKKWFKLKYTTLSILLLILCSCDNETAIDGTVNEIEHTTDYGYKYKVRVRKFRSFPEIDGGHYYWFLTNDTLFVGDTIHIGKLKGE